MKNPEAQDIPATPNPLKLRDPQLVKDFFAFRSRIGDIVLDSLAPILADPAFRARNSSDMLADLYAAGQVPRILAKDNWTEHDLDTFDKYWRDSGRADLFADEFEAERHRSRASVETAQAKLLETETSIQLHRIKQPTLW